jgi:hypothetical protein
VGAGMGADFSILPRLPYINRADSDPMVASDHLGDQLTECYENGILPGEHGRLCWARPGKVLDLRQGGIEHQKLATSVRVET